MVRHGGVADRLVVVARRGDDLVATVVAADAPGVTREPRHGRVDEEPVAVSLRDVEAGPLVAIDEPTLDRLRLAHAAVLLGAADAALALALAHVTTREQFGRPLAAFQSVQHRLVDAFIGLEAVALALDDAAARADAGEPFALATADAGALACEATVAAALAAQQVHGGVGYLETTGLGVFTRRVLSEAGRLGPASTHRERRRGGPGPAPDHRGW
jgi:alkylation response protein AidB-like acyl-CoA dehydrogenase